MLLNELPDANAVFPLDNFTEPQNFQENFTETVDINTFLNKQPNLQVASLSSDVEETIVLPNVYEIATKPARTLEKNGDKNIVLTSTNVQNSTFPLFASLDSNLGANAEVVCVCCNKTLTMKEFETHRCCRIEDNGETKANEVMQKKNVKMEIEEVDALDSDTNTSCAICEKTFPNRITYLKHMDLHKRKAKKQEPNNCQYCQKVFKKPSDLVHKKYPLSSQ